MSYKVDCRAAPSSSPHATWARTMIPLADTLFSISYITCFKKKYYSLFKLSEYHYISNNCIKYTISSLTYEYKGIYEYKGMYKIKIVGTIVDNISNIQISITNFSFFSSSKYAVLSFRFKYLNWAVQIRDDWS